MVRVGIVGIGFMGATHFKAMQKVKGSRVAAIVSRDQGKRQGDWRAIRGNFGGDGGMQDLSKVRCYGTLEELLADPSIDLVDVCLPNYLHAGAALQALAAGKHVLVEKPIALSIPDANRLLAEARRCGRFLMVAHVLRCFPEFQLVKEMVATEEYGPVLAARFRRIISRPTWWGAEDLERTGGPAVDLHVHDTDFVQHLFGMPESVISSGYVGKTGWVEHIDTHYRFRGQGMAVSCESGWLAQQGCPFEHGYDVYFEQATLKYNSSWGQPPVLLTADGKSKNPKVSRTNGFVGELQEASDAVRRGTPSQLIGGETARNALLLCLREIQSVLSGRRVSV